jgi:hypothetical protein
MKDQDGDKNSLIDSSYSHLSSLKPDIIEKSEEDEISEKE